LTLNRLAFNYLNLIFLIKDILICLFVAVQLVHFRMAFLSPGGPQIPGGRLRC
jgi:hypothetical protein